MQDQLYMSMIELMPRSGFGRVVRRLAGWEGGGLIGGAAVSWFARRFAVATEEAELPLGSYPNLHTFFTRRLKPGVRPVDPDPGVVVSPVDGVTSEHGVIEHGLLTQVKGKTYSLEMLMGGAAEAAPFVGGTWLTIYLSPRHYHRIHSPVAGQIVAFDHLPGEFWPVNPPSVRTVENLFAVNERIVTYVESKEAGRVAVIKVAAVGVGHISLSYADRASNLPGQSRLSQGLEPALPVEKGGELGVFELGSTVILVFEPGRVVLDPLHVGQELKMGQRIGALSATGERP